MECKQVKHFLLHPEDLSAKYKNSLHQHLSQCSPCQSFFHETEELENLLNDYFSFPAMKHPLELVHTLPPSEQKNFRTSIAILTSVVFLFLFCSLLFIPTHSRQTPAKNTVQTEISFLPKAHIQASSSLISGGKGAIFLSLDNPQSLGKNTPPQVRAELLDSQGNTLYSLFPSKKIQDPQNQYPFEIPSDCASGEYSLKIVTVSADGDFTRNYQSAIQVTSPLKLFFQTDKPRYQPGQTIHLHAILFPSQKQSFQIPENTPIRFKVEDPKGNLVFQEDIQPDALGSAGTQFAIADEVSEGEYRLSAEYEHSKLFLEKEVLITRYLLPKIRIRLETPQQYYRPQESIPLTLFARYPYGKPIIKGKIEIELSDEYGHRYSYSNSNTLLETDAEGQFKTTLTLSNSSLDFQKPQKVYIVANITDEANQKETQLKSLFLADNPYQIHFVPEGGKLRLGVPNTLFCLATTPDGKPAALQIKFFDSYQEKTISIPEQGVTELSFTPNPQHVLGQGKNAFYPIAYQVQNSSTQKITLQIPVDPEKDQIYVTLDQAIYQPGQPFHARIFGNNPGSSLFLTLSQEGIVLLQTTLNSPENAETAIEWNAAIPLNATGTLSLTVSQLLSHGKWIHDQRTCFVRPTGTNIQVTSQKLKNSFRPGEPISLDFEVSESAEDGSKKAIESGALAVFVVDEAVFGFPAKNLAQLFYELENQLRQHRASILSAETISASLQKKELYDAQQKTAKAFYAIQEQKSSFNSLEVFYTEEDINRTKSVLAKRLLPYLLDQEFLIGTPPKNIDPRLFVRMVQDLKLPIDSPLLDSITLKTLLEHPDVDPQLKKLSIQELIQKIKQLRRQSLEEICPGESSHPQILKILEEKNISKQRAFTPTGDPIVLSSNRKTENGISLQSTTPPPKTENVEELRSSAPQEIKVENTPHRRERLEKEKNDKIEEKQKQNEEEPSGGGILQNGKEEDKKDELLVFDWLKKGAEFMWGSDAKAEDAPKTETKIAPEKSETETSKGNRQAQKEALEKSRRKGFKRLTNSPENKKSNKLGQEDSTPASIPPEEKEESEPGGEKDSDNDEEDPIEDNAEKNTDSEISSEIAQLIRLRKYFPETLWVDLSVPIHQGKGSITIPEAPDSITTFRVQTTFFSKTGHLGQGQAEFVVFQPFFVDLHLPTHFTVTDEISLPIILHNYLDKTQEVEVLLQKAEWFKYLPTLKTENPIGETDTHYRIIQQILPKKVIAVEIPIQILQAGNQEMRVEARAINGEGKDGMLKKVLVLPEGQKQTQGQNILLLPGTTPLTWNRPDDKQITNAAVSLHVYPDLLSHLRNTSTSEVSYGGLEEVIRYGLPQLLLYQELKTQNRLTRQEEIEISYIFQRLLSYQNGDGFSRFRNGEPDVLLTAFGLWMLYEFRTFQNWEPQLITKNKEFLLAKRNEKKFYSPYPSSFSFSQDPIALTSFISWVLRKTGVRNNSNFQLTQNYLRHNFIETNNPLAEALYYLSIPSISTYISELKALKGKTLEESLSISALRLIILRKEYEGFEEDVRLLLTNKQGIHGWGSLFLDIFATNALVLANKRYSNISQSVSLKIEEKTYQITPKLTYQIPLTLPKDKAYWTLSTSAPLFCQLVTTYYTPWKEKEDKTSSSLQVLYKALETPVSFPNWQAEVTFNTKTLDTHAPILLEIGLPPGFSAANLTELESIEAIEHFEQKSRHILVYLKPEQKQDNPLTFAIRLRPQFRVKATPPLSQYREMAFQGKHEESFSAEKINTLKLR